MHLRQAVGKAEVSVAPFAMLQERAAAFAFAVSHTALGFLVRCGRYAHPTLVSPCNVFVAGAVARAAVRCMQGEQVSTFCLLQALKVGTELV